MTGLGHGQRVGRQDGAQKLELTDKGFSLCCFPIRNEEAQHGMSLGYFFHSDSLIEETLASHLLEFEKMHDPRWVSLCTTPRTALDSIFTEQLPRARPWGSFGPTVHVMPSSHLRTVRNLFHLGEHGGGLQKIWGRGDMMRVLILGIILTMRRGLNGRATSHRDQFEADSR